MIGGPFVRVTIEGSQGHIGIYRDTQASPKLGQPLQRSP